MAPLENMPAEQEQSKQGVGQRLWSLLTEPASSITDRADRRQARVLSSFLLVFSVLTGIRALVGLISGSNLEEPGPFYAIFVLIVLLLVSYGFSRTRYYTVGAVLAVTGTIAFVLVTVLLRGNYEESQIFSSLMWLILALLLGSGFFSWRTMLVISFLTLASILALAVFIPELAMSAVMGAFSRIFAICVLIIVVNLFRDQLEADRQLELNLANQELEDARGSLELRVAERTQALQLATEISRVLSQITDLQDLLQESVETIRSQFNLYYVQIYLLDANTDMLVLQVGTGNIGQELARRAHQLPLGSSSINGMAASEKRIVIVSDTAANPLFKPNSMLPRTRSEMAVPLIIGSRVVGVLDLQSDVRNGLSYDNLPAFEALAGQLTVAIENAKLISEAAQAQATIESYTRRVTREAWSEYFEPVIRQQFVGFSYRENQLVPLASPLPQTSDRQNVARVSIDVIGEPIGAIQVEADEDRDWTNDDLDLIRLVATQVGQQVEILRSLDQASHFREEAERTLRRITHESWREYETVPALADGFVYDQQKIKPATAVSTDDPTTILRHDLSIHGEAIGELALVRPEGVDDEFAGELITAVADQLVSHMENLRLAEQTESALTQSQQRSRQLSIINSVAEATADLTGIHEFLETVQQQLVQAIPMNSFTAATYNKADNTIFFEYAYDEKSGRHENTPPIQLQPYHLSYKTVMEAAPQIIHFTEAEVEEQKRNRPPNMMSEDASITASLLFVPLVSGRDVVGVLSAQSYQFNAYTQEHINLLSGVAGYVTTAIQKTRLFEQTQARAEELAVINDVAQAVSQQMDRTAMIKTVQAQIQRIIPVDAFFIALFDRQTQLLEYPYIFDNEKIYHTPPEPPSTTSTVYQVLQTGEPVLINRTQQQIDDLFEKQKETRLGDVERISASLLYIPLFSGQNTSGVLSVQSYQLNAYHEGSLSLLSSIASHVAVALENARLLEESRQTAEREQILRGISTTINTSIDAESVLQTAAREIGRTLGLETYVYLTPTPVGTTKIASNTPVNTKQNGNGLEIDSDDIQN